MPDTWSLKKIFVALLVFLLFAGVWQCINSPMVATVSGTGEVSVVATDAVISFSVSATDASIQNAIANVNAKALTAREVLKSKGVIENDIAQSQVVTAPGFTATITMAAKTSNITGLSTLITDLYKNGVTVVSQPVLSVQNQDELEGEAFNLAMKNARGEARKIGRSNWKFLRKLVAIAQSESSNTSTATTSSEASENGAFKIVKTVSATYKMW